MPLLRDCFPAQSGRMSDRGRHGRPGSTTSAAIQLCRRIHDPGRQRSFGRIQNIPCIVITICNIEDFENFCFVDHTLKSRVANVSKMYYSRHIRTNSNIFGGYRVLTTVCQSQFQQSAGMVIGKESLHHLGESK